VSVDRAESRGDAAIRVLLRAYSARTGRWRTPTGEAWQPALAIQAVLLAYERTHEPTLLQVLGRSFARYRGRRSRFFDDDGWYLTTWLRAYDVTGDPSYLTEARAIFQMLTNGWDDHCGGGLWWSSERTYKNAITNELFILAAAGLARRTEEPEYARWARRAWAWFDDSGLINDDDLVNDGLDGSCANNGQTTWTYNQGVILSALVELFRLEGEPTYLTRAARIANAAMAGLVHSGHEVLREALDDVDNRDSHVFKGVLAQGLARWYGVDPDANRHVRRFLSVNADAVWRDGSCEFGLRWLDGTGPVNTATTISAALLLNEVDLIESRSGFS
jgi:predicted alpha-1,6-mannanase (GH76 family)